MGALTAGVLGPRLELNKFEARGWAKKVLGFLTSYYEWASKYFSRLLIFELSSQPHIDDWQCRDHGKPSSTDLCTRSLCHVCLVGFAVQFGTIDNGTRARGLV